MQQFSLAYHSIYVRNWRVLGAIWVLCALSTTVLQTLVLIHPAWIGNDEGGYFGLYDYCGTNECSWSPFRVRPLSFSFELSAFMVLSATVLSVLAVFSILLLVLLRDRYVFLLCSWMHLFSFMAMLGGCVVYPNGWENPRVREICESKKYNLGLCQLRWPYLLAFVLIFDQLTLSMLGFVAFQLTFWLETVRFRASVEETRPSLCGLLFVVTLFCSVFYFCRFRIKEPQEGSRTVPFIQFHGQESYQCKNLIIHTAAPD
ncbi:unnamed protein product [Caenorhabditis auriculariae]|uniref:Uncharacterized protein n=1 Tax=Caenorhabditis auriculariae TaxID=2777116 RepID=A0A8S1HND7_9PELO|nr:unnamed protein product [Caenorhabditis auriculariae]